MVQIVELDSSEINFEDILELYKSVNWQNYTNQPETLQSAINNSHKTWLCLADEKVVGLLRTISDGYTITYIQDILVHPDYQNQGFGSELLRNCLNHYHNIRQKILLTDDSESQISFYEKNGFIKVAGKLNAFYKFE